jgi:hypothetical protein
MSSAWSRRKAEDPEVAAAELSLYLGLYDGWRVPERAIRLLNPAHDDDGDATARRFSLLEID